ncbi:MAG: serine/threonine-protein kinase, partial [Myxococcota bacterium]
YRASHVMLRRPTAVKLLLPGVLGEEGLLRFEREVRQTARLTHPNTVTVYDYGRTPDGVFYYAMELIGGASLATIVRRTGALSAARVVAILDQVASALEAAHAERIVHRDVKPSNVLLQRDARFEETVKVVDFGVAKAPGAYRRDPGAGFAGTPLYMAPEAVSEAFERVSPAADIYALGALGFYLLTARHAFHGRTRMETRVRHARGPRPSARRRRPDVCSPELDALLVAMMDLSPDARPDASAVRARLAACPEAGAWTDADERAWWASEGADVAHAPSDSEALTHTVFPDLTDPAAVTQDLRTGPRAAADTPT